MSTIAVKFPSAVLLTVEPSASSVARFVRLASEVSDNQATLSSIVIGWYGDCWSLFQRKSPTDFDRQEWIKRNFKRPAQELEATLKRLDSGFSVKDELYKKVKGTLAKLAYIGGTPELVLTDSKSLAPEYQAAGFEAIRYKTHAEIVKEVKQAGGGERMSEMILRCCGIIAPIDDETGECKYTREDYSQAGIDIDQDERLTAAFQALVLTVGVARAKQMVDYIDIETRNAALDRE